MGWPCSTSDCISITSEKTKGGGVKVHFSFYINYTRQPVKVQTQHIKQPTSSSEEATDMKIKCAFQCHSKLMLGKKISITWEAKIFIPVQQIV